MNHERHNSSKQGPIDRRRFVHRAAMVSAAGLGVPMLAGCEILAALGDERYNVEMTRNRRFEPASLVIPLGGTVIWENTASRVHWVTTDESDLEEPQEGGEDEPPEDLEEATGEFFDAGDAIQLPDNVWPWSSGIMYPGDTWALEFTVPGAYVYVDRYYYDKGMIGTIIVEE